MKRIGNVIGTPTEPTSTSASGTFRITAQQQRNINTSFPQKALRRDLPYNVSILAYGYSALVAGSYQFTGEIILRFADPEKWVDKEDYANVNANTAFISSHVFRDETGRNSVHSGFRARVTNHTNQRTLTYTFSGTANVGSKVQRSNVNTADSAALPTLTDALTYDDKYYTLSLQSFKQSATDSSAVNGTYTVQVFNQESLGDIPADELNLIQDDPTQQNYSNSAAIVGSGCRQVDLLLVAGGGAGGQIREYYNNPNTGNRPDISSGSGGGGGILVGYAVPVPASTFTITVGLGGNKYASAGAANGGGSSAIGCYVPGGGHGAWAGLSSANIVAGGNGGCGGGSVSFESHSVSARMTGRAGLSTISASSTLVTGGLYFLYGNDGGFFAGGNYMSEANAATLSIEAFTANSSYAIKYNSGTVRNKAIGNQNQNDGGGIGGGAGHIGSIQAGARRGSNGVYVSWATPGLTHLSSLSPHPVSAGTTTLPLITGIAYNNSFHHTNDGTQGGPLDDSQAGYFGASGSSERNEMPGKGGGGIGQRRNNANFSAQTSQSVSGLIGNITVSADGIHGTGGGGGSIFAQRMNSVGPGVMFGGSGGNGIVVIRVPEKAAYTVTRSCDDQIDYGPYRLYVFASANSTHTFKAG